MLLFMDYARLLCVPRVYARRCAIFAPLDGAPPRLMPRVSRLMSLRRVTLPLTPRRAALRQRHFQRAAMFMFTLMASIASRYARCYALMPRYFEATDAAAASQPDARP